MIAAAIQKHNAKRQAQQDVDQRVQDALASVELACETNPGMGGSSGAVGCRTTCFALGSFIHKHHKDFLPNQKNVGLLLEAIGRTPEIEIPDPSLVTEQTFEMVFQHVDKKQLDK